MNVLIAEDNPAIQALHERVMNVWNYSFDMASNGVEAVEYALCNKGKYDFCLMDIEMPEMNGIDAIKIIREKVDYFPIVAFSANYAYKRQCLEIGADSFFEKPCAPSVLLEKIKQLVVKSLRLTFEHNGFVINEEMPVDQKHAKELRELAKRGLCKMRLRGSGAHDVTFTVHKHVPFNISHDFIEDESEITTFIDRDDEHPAECYLYKSSCLIPVVLLDDEQYADKCQQEDEKMKHRKALVTVKKNK